MVKTVIPELTQMNIHTSAKKKTVLPRIMENIKNVDGTREGLSEGREDKNFLPMLEEGMANLNISQKKGALNDGTNSAVENQRNLSNVKTEKGFEQKVETNKGSQTSSEDHIMESHIVKKIGKEFDLSEFELLLLEKNGFIVMPSPMKVFTQNQTDSSEKPVLATGNELQSSVITTLGKEKDNGRDLHPALELSDDMVHMISEALKENGVDEKTISEVIAAVREHSDVDKAPVTADLSRNADCISKQIVISEQIAPMTAENKSIVERKAGKETASNLLVTGGDSKYSAPVQKEVDATVAKNYEEAFKASDSTTSRIDNKIDTISFEERTDVVEESFSKVMRERGLDEKTISRIMATVRDRSNVDKGMGAVDYQGDSDRISGRKMISEQKEPVAVDNNMVGRKAVKEAASNQLVGEAESAFVVPDQKATEALAVKVSGEATCKVIDSTIAKIYSKSEELAFTQKGKVVVKDTISAGRMDFTLFDAASTNLKASDVKTIDGQLLVNQIISQLSDEPNKASGRVKITLSPENLGSLDMDIILKENKVQVVMIADRSDVRQVLQSQSDVLRNALQEQGLQVNGIDFLLRGNLQGMSGESGGTHFGWRENNNSSAKREKGEDEMSSSLPIPSFLERQNGEYAAAGISLYV